MSRFSILIPMYNAQPFIADALQSVLNQSCQDYEVVLIDDGSTDGSGEICDSFALRAPRVTVIHQENMGLLLARRVALRHAAGDYIVTLDADDALRPDALERLSLVIDECEPDIIGFAFSRSAGFGGALCGALPMPEGLYAGNDYGHYERMVCEGRLVSMWGKCYKRSIADVDADYSGLRGLTYAEDLLQSMPLARAARSFYYLEEPLYYYRPNPQGCTAHYVARYLDDLMVALGAFLDYASHVGRDCTELARRSALLQVLCLAHILVESNLPCEQKDHELGVIQARILAEGLVGPWSGQLRADKRWEMRALMKGRFGVLRTGISLVEAAKRLRNRVRAK